MPPRWMLSMVEDVGQQATPRAEASSFYCRGSLEGRTVGILGIGELSLRVALLWAGTGIRSIAVSDPYLVGQNEARSWEFSGSVSEGAPRHLAVARALRF